MRLKDISIPAIFITLAACASFWLMAPSSAESDTHSAPPPIAVWLEVNHGTRSDMENAIVGIKAWGDNDAMLEVLTGQAGCIEKKKDNCSAVGRFAKALGRELGETTQMMSVPARQIAQDVNSVVDARKSESTPIKKRARRRAAVRAIFGALTGL